MKKRVAIVGFGFMGRMHYGVWRRLKGAEVVAICDANLAQLTAKVKGNRPGVDNSRPPASVRSYADFDAMLAAAGVDIVDITLPTALHPDMSAKALSAGCHVLCEKPMALSVADCDRMLKAAAQSKGHLMIGQCCRFDPDYLCVKELVDSGKYGKVVAADLTRFCPAPGWNNGGKSWFADETRSGGAALDMHIHDVDLVRYFFGDPASVFTRTHVRADGLTDHLTTTYLFDNLVVTADTSWAAAGTLVFDKACRIFFEKATVYLGSRYTPTVTVYPQVGKPFSPKLPKGSNYENEIRYFLDEVNGKTPRKRILTATDARNAVALVMLEKRSAATGRVVPVKGLVAH